MKASSPRATISNRASGENGRLPRLLSPREVAQALSVSRSLVYRLIDTGKMPYHRIGERRGAIRVSEDDLADFLATCRREVQEEARRPPQRVRKLKHLTV
ncbi:MAG: helix-turn-helix domain-containing protein [bacterium]